LSISSPAASLAPSAASVRARRQARAHSRLVHVLRWAFPTLILALFGLLGTYVVQEAMRQAHARPQASPTEIRMVSPHFVGRDNVGRAFDLVARVAQRDDVNMQRILLTSPIMKLDVDSPHPKTLTADHGVYDEDTRLLRLQGHVRVDDSTASTVGTAEALVDTKAGTVTGVSGVSGTGPMGAIQAGSYTASQKNGTVVMHGGVHAVLRSH
jgi:lipopolysaccharide export system protein LptC